MKSVFILSVGVFLQILFSPILKAEDVLPDRFRYVNDVEILGKYVITKERTEEKSKIVHSKSESFVKYGLEKVVAQVANRDESDFQLNQGEACGRNWNGISSNRLLLDSG